VADNIKLAMAGLVVVLGVAGFYTLGDASVLVRAGVVVLAVVAAAAMALTSAPGREAVEFAKGSRMEVRKVVWPTRRETMQTTLFVMVLVVLIGLYLWLLDRIMFWVVYDLTLGTGNV